MIVCALIEDEQLRDRLRRLGARAGWRVLFAADERDLLITLISGKSTPDVIVSDEPEKLTGIGALPTARIHLPPDSGVPGTDTFDPSLDDGALLQHINNCVNARRFRARFAAIDRNEPITSLPRHEELFDSLAGHVEEPVGMMVIKVDHAEHLYANLDPVTKTDLLAALSERLESKLPIQARLGFYDPTCFVVTLPNIQPSELERVGNDVRLAVSTPLVHAGGEIHLTISVGCSFAAVFNDTNQLWADTWAAATAASHAGGDRVVGANPDNAISERIPSALERDEFSLLLQPQWGLQSNRLTAVEALLRWQGHDIGGLAPSHFIPIVEQQGQMARVGDWVLERACRETADWLPRMVQPILLAVNVSPQQFNGRSIVTQISRNAAEHRLNTTSLELELSQRNMLRLVDDYREQVYTLRDWGVRFAIDNLGGGLIEPEKLLRCPVDTLKIDRSVVSALTRDTQAADLAAQICELGERFNLRVVGVGVETEEQLSMLAEWGCKDAQGMLVSRPVPVTGFQHVMDRLADFN
ncbi:MAG: EAL domain-containing protein [Pseudomonadales bacterium]|nr:GGDEF domain-containing protein [Pseudomonadales bacterium]NIX08394.1 EAL domain-containing protein [Pseudomonadales bacterium]